MNKLKTLIENNCFSFISDIRLAKDDKSIIENNNMQDYWLLKLNAHFSLLKFRLQFYNENDSYKEFNKIRTEFI